MVPRIGLDRGTEAWRSEARIRRGGEAMSDSPRGERSRRGMGLGVDCE